MDYNKAAEVFLTTVIKRGKAEMMHRFNTYSQAPHINALARTSERSEKKLKKMLIKYSIRNKDGSVGLSDLGWENE